MRRRLAELYLKNKELILYLIFGVLTTFVGWAVYFVVLLCGKGAMGIPADQTSGGKYLLVYTAAQVIQWVAAVLFAYFTNRKWVFTEADKNAPVLSQLCVFAAGRLATFGLDYVVTFFGAMALSSILPALSSVSMLGREWNLNEIGAKVVAAVIVIIGNYIFSKLVVFKKKG